MNRRILRTGIRCVGVLAVFIATTTVAQEAGGVPNPAGDVPTEVAEAVEEAAPAFDTGHTAWMLVSCALVLFMTPGLALFYGGMVRTKNVLGTMMHSMACMGIMSVVWVVIGYSIAFGSSKAGGLFGDPFEYLCLKGITEKSGGSYPQFLDVAFQMMFAIITPALITGAFAERVKFRGFVIFTVLWGIFVYSPLVHWVWGGGILSHAAEGPETWLQSFTGHGALDFAGGNVVHLSSGISALVFCILVGKRRGSDQPMLPNCLIWTMLGAGILWFGWYGFNGGSALASDGIAALAFLNTHICAAVAAVAWSVIERIHHGKASALGFASGLVAGLVCITPAAGFVEPRSAIIMGVVVAVICYAFVMILKGKLGYDDSLDAFGIHGVGGATGGLLTGLLTTEALNGVSGIDGGFSQAYTQFVSIVVTALFALVMTLIIFKLVDLTVGIRLTQDEESDGLDVSQHGEQGYNL